MNTPANALPESQAGSQPVAPIVTSTRRLLYWSIRRELWENRSVYIVPAAAAAVFLAGFLINAIVQRQRMRTAAWTHETFTVSYELAAALIMGSAVIVGVFYSLDALYGERRDRSILFWKSLPVSDLTTVLSKVSIPLAILPLLSFVITIVTQFTMLLLSSAVFLGSGLDQRMLWSHAPFLHVSLMLLYHLVTVHGLWYAPIYGWFFLVSAWAPRAPFIWAFVPPFVICGMEKLAFNSTHFFDMLMRRLSGPEAPPASGVGASAGSGTMMDAISALGPLQFFSEPGLWIGLAIAAACLAAAVRLRRSRGPA